MGVCRISTLIDVRLCLRTLNSTSRRAPAALFFRLSSCAPSEQREVARANARRMSRGRRLCFSARIGDPPFFYAGGGSIPLRRARAEAPNNYPDSHCHVFVRALRCCIHMYGLDSVGVSFSRVNSPKTTTKPTPQETRPKAKIC